MANTKFSMAIHLILCYTILLLSVKMIKFSGVDAKSCLEGLPWVKVICNRGEVDQPCWLACQERHGLAVKAYCDNPDPDFPRYFCYCSWPC